MAKEYVTPRRLGSFLTQIKTLFASVSHKHKVSDLTDYVVDGALSPTSTNPVQNKVLDEEFEAVSTALQALETALDEHSHEIADINKLQETLDEFDANKTQVRFVIHGDDD